MSRSIHRISAQCFLIEFDWTYDDEIGLKTIGRGGGLQVVVGAVDDNDDNGFLELFSKHENVAVSGQNISTINHGKMVI